MMKYAKLRKGHVGKKWEGHFNAKMHSNANDGVIMQKGVAKPNTY